MAEAQLTIRIHKRWFHEPASWALAIAVGFGLLEFDRAAKWLLDHTVVIEVW